MIIGDRKNKAVVPGAEVIVDQWQVLRNEPYRIGPTASTGPCNPLG